VLPTALFHIWHAQSSWLVVLSELQSSNNKSGCLPPNCQVHSELQERKQSKHCCARRHVTKVTSLGFLCFAPLGTCLAFLVRSSLMSNTIMWQVSFATLLKCHHDISFSMASQQKVVLVLRSMTSASATVFVSLTPFLCKTSQYFVDFTFFLMT
jgi:hypothetical protein